MQNGFVNWDDLANLVDNLNYRGLGWRHLRWMFTTFHESLYRPITGLTLGLDYLLWGMDPVGYPLTSLLFHGVNGALFYFVAQRFLRLAPGEPYFDLGNLAARQNQIDQAIAYFQQALKLDPNHAPAHNNLGRLLAAHGKLDEAVYHFRQALRVDPKFAAAQESLIAALSQQSKKAEPICRYP